MKTSYAAVIILAIIAAIAAVLYYFRDFIKLKLGYIGKILTEKTAGAPVNKSFTEIASSQSVQAGYIGIYQYQGYEATIGQTALNNLLKGQLSDLSAVGLDVAYAKISWNQTAFGSIRDIALGIVVKVSTSTTPNEVYQKLGNVSWLKEAIIGQQYMQPYKSYSASA